MKVIFSCSPKVFSFTLAWTPLPPQAHSEAGKTLVRLALLHQLVIMSHY